VEDDKDYQGNGKQQHAKRTDVNHRRQWIGKIPATCDLQPYHLENQEVVN